MPTISARIREGNTVRRHENKYGPGITPHYLDSDQVGIVEFDSTLFTAEQAKEWLSSHDYSYLSLAAGEEQAEKHKRNLTIEFSPSADIQEVDGGLLVPGVKLLAPGTWTDSTQKTPCRYTGEVLERYHANWIDFSYWSRHGGGAPRDLTTEWIADIRNLRYQDGVIADLFYHGITNASQEAIKVIRAAQAGKIPFPYSSVEMMTRDKWIISEKLYEAQEVVFLGAAMVKEGACRVCRIRNNEWIQEEPKVRKEPEPEKELEQEPEQKKQESEMADNKELEAQIETLKKELETLKAAQKPPETPKAEIPKELTESISTLEKTIKELSGRLEKIEKGPADPATQGTEGTSHELETPEGPVFDKKSGTTRSV